MKSGLLYLHTFFISLSPSFSLFKHLNKVSRLLSPGLFLPSPFLATSHPTYNQCVTSTELVSAPHAYVYWFAFSQVTYTKYSLSANSKLFHFLYPWICFIYYNLFVTLGGQVPVYHLVHSIDWKMHWRKKKIEKNVCLIKYTKIYNIHLAIFKYLYMAVLIRK